jgi:hypothetical protein
MAHKGLFPVGLGALLTVTLVGLNCSSSGDTSGTGGSTAGTGGSSATGGTAQTGGSSSTGTGGAGTGGTASDSGAGTIPIPVCLNGVTKGGACTMQTPEGMACYKTCGPSSIGWKAETCQSGLYVEGDCNFVTGVDYACYKANANTPACPAGTRAGAACTMGMCMPCGGKGMDYLDTSNVAKTGYCICPAGADAPKWTCGSTSSCSWPCLQDPACVATNGGC